MLTFSAFGTSRLRPRTSRHLPRRKSGPPVPPASGSGGDATSSSTARRCFATSPSFTSLHATVVPLPKGISPMTLIPRDTGKIANGIVSAVCCRPAGNFFSKAVSSSCAGSNCPCTLGQSRPCSRLTVDERACAKDSVRLGKKTLNCLTRRDTFVSQGSVLCDASNTHSAGQITRMGLRMRELCPESKSTRFDRCKQLKQVSLLE